MISLKVDNLTRRTTIVDLKQVFERFGKIGDIYIPRNKFTHESRGFAFVRFLDQQDADNAIEMLQGHVVDGRHIRVQIARYGRPTLPIKRSQRRNYFVLNYQLNF
ncbi:RNA recognition motif domain [Cinara cedri]|uniref:Serine/arginine-rich splicing factor 2 n=1 Tax=Cinara cedri TaxID=506608 RepID=A0A5E4NEY5_9HEMI|nr:RNA recognition motif domain [Cinara cedri]